MLHLPRVPAFVALMCLLLLVLLPLPADSQADIRLGFGQTCPLIFALDSAYFSACWDGVARALSNPATPSKLLAKCKAPEPSWLGVNQFEVNSDSNANLIFGFPASSYVA